jgi:hypothetical protein
MRRVVLTAVAVGGMAMLPACGSGGSHNNNPAVVVSPATMNVQQGSTQQLTATVINSNNPAVNVSAILGHGIVASRAFMFENDAHADE